MNADERGWSAPIRHPVGREALPAQSAFAVPFHAKPLARGRWSARKQARLTRRKPGEDRESHGDPRGIGRRALGRTSPGSSHHRGLRPPHPSSTDPILGHTGLAQGSAIRTTLRTARQPSPAVAGALVGISAMGAGRVKNAVANGHRATICRRLSQRQVAMFRSETILANSCSLPLRSDVFTRPRSNPAVRVGRPGYRGFGWKAAGRWLPRRGRFRPRPADGLVIVQGRLVIGRPAASWVPTFCPSGMRRASPGAARGGPGSPGTAIQCLFQELGNGK